jgi:transposase
MIRMLLVGYVFAIRSERRICAEIQVNLAYRWFCKLGVEDKIPDHSGAVSGAVIPLRRNNS